MREDQQKRRHSLPWWMVWAGFGIFSLAGWMRMADSINNWYWLNFAGVSPGPLYLIISGGLWGIAGLAALVWLSLRLPGYRQVCSGVAMLFALTYWIDRLFISSPEGTLPNGLFAFFFTLFCLAFVLQVVNGVSGLGDLFPRRSQKKPEGDTHVQV